MTKRRFLITGGAGFIGSHLAEALLARGDAVVVLDNLSTGLRANLPEPVELVVGDIADSPDLAPLLRQVDGCFHLAAIASVQQYREGWALAARTNLIGSVRVLESAASAGIPVVYASSAAVYGDAPPRALDEATPTRPISGYGTDKLGLELHAGAISDMFGLRAVGLRFFNVFGPRQAPGSPYSGVISIFFDRMARGEGVTIFGDGAQTRDFVYVADVARALGLAMDHATVGGCGVFNVCTGLPLSVAALAEAVGRELRVAPRITHAPARAGDIRVSLGDGRAAREVLGFVPDTTLKEALAHTGAWFSQPSQADSLA